MWRNIKQKMIHLNVGLLSLGLLYWLPSHSVWPRDKDVRFTPLMMKLLQRDFDLVSNSWPMAAEMPFAAVGPFLTCNTTPILHTLDMQGEHKGNKCVTQSPVSCLETCTNGTRGVSWKIAPPPFPAANCPQQKINSRTHDAMNQQRAGARVDLCKQKQHEVYCTTQSDLKESEVLFTAVILWLPKYILLWIPRCWRRAVNTSRDLRGWVGNLVGVCSFPTSVWFISVWICGLLQRFWCVSLFICMFFYIVKKILFFRIFIFFPYFLNKNDFDVSILTQQLGFDSTPRGTLGSRRRSLRSAAGENERWNSLLASLTPNLSWSNVNI